jgi:hypothetical protein
MMLYVQRRKPQLEDLSEEQLDAIISASNFWQRDMERRSLESQDSQSAYAGWSNTDLGLQLSLFNEISTGDSTEL